MHHDDLSFGGSDVSGGGLLLLAGGFAVALGSTQQGKYLIRAMIAAGLAAAVVAVEWAWVTDNERIEQVVYDLRDAVVNSDVDGDAVAHDAGRAVFQRGIRRWTPRRRVA